MKELLKEACELLLKHSVDSTGEVDKFLDEMEKEEVGL